MNGSTQTTTTEPLESQRPDQELCIGHQVKSTHLEIPDLMILEPKTFSDERGLFMETFNEREMRDIGISDRFVQDNHSVSKRHVLRGLHYQIRQPQGKLIRVVVGEIFDVAVDLRVSSTTFGKHIGVKLSAPDHRLFWVPKGFAHGFVVLSESAEVLYKASDYYAPQYERTIVWNDPDLRIQWPVISSRVIVSEKDNAGSLFLQSEYFS